MTFPIPDFFSLTDVCRANQRIAPLVIRTPLVLSTSLSSSRRVVKLKLENLQATTSFKLRGASNAVLSLSNDEIARGVVTASTGNHGRGIAYAARHRKAHATVFVSQQVPNNKVKAILATGARVEKAGNDYAQADAAAREHAVAVGAKYIGPFDDLAILAGQATVGLELMEQWPDVDAVLVPLSGGGLLGGLGYVVKKIKPTVRVIGACMSAGAAMYASLMAGKPMQVDEIPSLADCLEGNIGLDNRYTFPLVRAVMERCELLSEDEIAEGMRHAFRAEKLILEGAAAVGLSVLLGDRAQDLVGNIAVIISGANVDLHTWMDVIRGNWRADGFQG